ncbi:hypothetical protein [Actinophytocola sediminis]
MIATAIGGLLARQWYEDPGPGAPDAVLPSESSVPIEEQPGSRLVQGTSDAIAHPLYETLREVLQAHFDAINTRDYESWAGTVAEHRVTSQPKDTWLENYRSTQDGNIVVYRIELAVAEDETEAEGEDTVAARVLMNFTSVQDLADAPPELREECIHWNVVLPMVREDDTWKIDSGIAASSPQHEACA